MRIRKRPSQSPDPWLQALPPNGNGRRGAAAEEGLHPVGDLRVHHPGEISNSTSVSDPHPDQALPARRRLFQGLKEEEEERGVDSNKGCNARATSCCCCSSSGAVASSGAVQTAEMVTLQKKMGGGNNYGNGNAGPISSGTKTTIVERQEKEDKVRVKGRASASASPASPASSAITDSIVSCTSRSIIGSNGKRRKSPAVVMEGSRCSRVNGRGWRCCQQTLVGYSLCEHHLGKGRLRSMSSSAARGQLGTSKPKWRMNHAAIPPASPQNQAEDHEEKPLAAVLLGDGLDKIEEEEDDEKTIERKMSWKKVGAVKARSISSLLDNMDNHDPSSPHSLVSQAPEVAPSIYQ